MNAYRFEHPGWCVICEAEVTFTARYDWFRDHLKCPRCDSVPRERALMHVVAAFYPHWRDLRIHEMAPIGRGASKKLREAAGYRGSHYYPALPLGERAPRAGSTRTPNGRRGRTAPSTWW
jgi:hypothetical protein